MVQVIRHVVAFQRGAVYANKLLRAPIGPGGEFHVVDHPGAIGTLLALPRSEVDTIRVVQEVYDRPYGGGRKTILG